MVGNSGVGIPGLVLPVCPLSRSFCDRIHISRLSEQTGAGEHIVDLPLVAKVARDSTAKVNSPTSPCRIENRFPMQIRIPPAADACAATVADRAPAQFAVRTVIVRLMRRVQKSGSRNLRLTSLQNPLPYGCGLPEHNICGFV